MDRAFPPALGRLHAVGTEVLARDGRTLALLPAEGGVWRFRVRAEDVSPALIETLVRVEDRRFWWHPGVDPVALARAVWQDIRAGRIVSGDAAIAIVAADISAALRPRRHSL